MDTCHLISSQSRLSDLIQCQGFFFLMNDRIAYIRFGGIIKEIKCKMKKFGGRTLTQF